MRDFNHRVGDRLSEDDSWDEVVNQGSRSWPATGSVPCRPIREWDEAIYDLFLADPEEPEPEEPVARVAARSARRAYARREPQRRPTSSSSSGAAGVTPEQIAQVAARIARIGQHPVVLWLEDEGFAPSVLAVERQWLED